MTAFQTCSSAEGMAVSECDSLSLFFLTENAISAFGNDTDLKSATNQAPGSNTNTYNHILPVTSTETTTTTNGAATETEQNLLRPQMPTQVQAFMLT